jgi:hypothetical protein
MRGLLKIDSSIFFLKEHQWKFHVRHIQLVALFCEVTNYVIEDGALRQ